MRGALRDLPAAGFPADPCIRIKVQALFAIVSDIYYTTRRRFCKVRKRKCGAAAEFSAFFAPAACKTGKKRYCKGTPVAD